MSEATAVAELQVSEEIKAQVRDTIREAFLIFKQTRNKKKSIVAFYYKGEDGTTVIQRIPEAAYMKRRRYKMARDALKKKGLPIPDELKIPAPVPKGTQVIIVPKPVLKIPKVLQEIQKPKLEFPHLEPFEVPTKNGAKQDPWASIIPPKFQE